MYEFRPCPFCGSTNIGIEKERRTYGHGEYPLIAYVECRDCGAHTKDFIVDGFYGETTTEADAVNAWNRSADL